jgi:RAB protein geranylgeranyltransferase component A
VVKAWLDPKGYLQVTLRPFVEKKRVAVHQAVATAFHGPCPEGMVVAHLNGVSTDNRPDNLAFATQKENISHKVEHGTYTCGDKHHFSKISDAECLEILEEMKTSKARKLIAEDHGVSLSHIYALRAGRMRKHLFLERI